MGLKRLISVLPAILLIAALAVGLSACGKRGGLVSPADKPSTYPKSYPTQ
jgi:predicted small lipoprotein YifL